MFSCAHWPAMWTFSLEKCLFIFSAQSFFNWIIWRSLRELPLWILPRTHSGFSKGVSLLLLDPGSRVPTWPGIYYNKLPFLNYIYFILLVLLNCFYFIYFTIFFIFLLISSLTHRLFSSMLFNIHVFVNLPVVFL
ncbi:unnamed protein product [Nyctereutes procyonoides]|uniref:(raccoon dog) hypothetical protein n=1 Tax=Nyctereutes procyonoides TaxID=34880 RepID=A0A811ZQC6_NYCPR|nr:unnamed protein product [Nyctereutes procyonoides]